MSHRSLIPLDEQIEKRRRDGTARLHVLTSLATLGQATVEQLSVTVRWDKRRIASHVANLRSQRAVVAVAEAPEGRGRPRVWAVTDEGRAIMANPSAQRLPKREIGWVPPHVREARDALGRFYDRERARLLRAGCSRDFVALWIADLRESIGASLAATLPTTRLGEE